MARKNRADLSLIIFFTFLILAVLSQYAYSQLPSQSSQPTGTSGQKSPLELFLAFAPIVGGILGFIAAALIAFFKTYFVSKNEFNRILETSLRSALTQKEIIDIIHNEGGFIRKEEIEKSIHQIITSTSSVMSKDILNIVLFHLNLMDPEERKRYFVWIKSL